MGGSCCIVEVPVAEMISSGKNDLRLINHIVVPMLLGFAEHPWGFRQIARTMMARLP